MNVRKITPEEFHMREAIGTIRASRFVREYAKTKKPITLNLIYKIHELIYKEAWPEIAGKRRNEELKKQWHSYHLPPHPSQIFQHLKNLELDFQEKLDTLKPARIIDPEDEESVEKLNEVLEVSVRVHHKITWIHPFRDGNGRVARLMSNLILERYGLLPGFSSRVERDNRNTYLEALKQADDYDDFQPLIELTAEGVIERYYESSRVSLE